MPYSESDDTANKIPDEFYSMNTGAPFDKCLDCERNLLEPGVFYVIEKAIRQYPNFTAKDVLFECAICLNCAERIKNELSKESLKSMITYYESKVLYSPHMKQSPVLSKCVVSGKPKEELLNYQINALCEGENLSDLQAPYLVSGEVVEEMSDLLSDETRNFLEDYQNQHMGPPEWLEDIPSGGKFVLI